MASGRHRWVVLLPLLSCVMTEYGFPIFRMPAPKSPPPAFEETLVQRARVDLRCREMTVKREMVPYVDSPQTSRPLYIARGCGGVWLANLCDGIEFIPLDRASDQVRCKKNSQRW